MVFYVKKIYLLFVYHLRMKILDFYYNDNHKTLMVQFSTKDDGDNFYRESILTYEDIIFYSPTIITRQDLRDMDISFVSERVESYFLENELPEQREL